MRECNGCTACCTWLIGDAYGWEFGEGKSCRFLECNNCGVHKVRPEPCENYFCAWAQEIIDEKYKPDKCGFLISVENGENGQYLKVVEIEKNSINDDVLNYFKSWSIQMNAPVVYSKSNI